MSTRVAPRSEDCLAEKLYPGWEDGIESGSCSRDETCRECVIDKRDCRSCFNAKFPFLMQPGLKPAASGLQDCSTDHQWFPPRTTGSGRKFEQPSPQRALSLYGNRGVQAESSRMEETKVRAAKKKQEDIVCIEEETSVDVSSNTLVKRERGRMQSSKKSKVRVTDIHPNALVSAKSNGESAQPRRGRGRPRLSDTKKTEQHGVKPKTTAVAQTAENVLNGGSSAPKRGRPKGTTKFKLESLVSGEEEEGSPVTPRKRGRPKKTPDKEPRIENTVSSEGDGETDGSQNSVKRERGRPRKHTREASSGISDTPPSRRGRPRKCIKQKELVTGGSQPERRGRGRPKGSLNKSRVLDKVGRLLRVPGLPAKGKKRGRPRLQPAKRGRPRKYPLPSPEEVKKPKMWKPLGRPRKYPRVETSAEALPAPRRSRGRPCKSDSKKGAHLRKNARSALSAPHADGVERKRGRPAGTAKGEGDVPRKRGRPKGSVNKNRARSGTQLDGLHSNAESELPAVGVESEVGFDTENILI